MTLCPLSEAFKEVDESIRKRYTNNYLDGYSYESKNQNDNSNGDMKFNYIDSATASMNLDPNSVKEMHVETVPKCPYCNTMVSKQNIENVIKSNSNDLVFISSLTLLFYLVLVGN